MQSAMYSCIIYESRRQSGRLVAVLNSFILLPRDAGNKTRDISKHQPDEGQGDDREMKPGNTKRTDRDPTRTAPVDHYDIAYQQLTTVTMPVYTGTDSLPLQDSCSDSCG